MLKGFLLLFLIFLNFEYSSAQEAYTQAEKNSFNSNVYSGCTEKQKQSELNKTLKAGVTEELCECYAGMITTTVFGNMNFQAALLKKDNLRAKRIIEESMNNENSVANFSICMDRLEKKYGSREKLFENKSNVIASNKIGLNGDSRASFIASGVSSCTKEAKDSNSYAVKKYCTCYMNYMADRLSQVDLIDMAKQTERMLHKSVELRKNGINSCENILN